MIGKKLMTLVLAAFSGAVWAAGTTDSGAEIVTPGGFINYQLPGSTNSWPVPHDWFVAVGMAKYGDSADDLSAKLVGPYAHGYTGWEAFVAGVRSTDQIFRAEIVVDADGVPQISWAPNLNAGTSPRLYRIKGCTSLASNDWIWPADRTQHHFFKVEVSMPVEGKVSDRPGPVPAPRCVQLWENGPYWAECNIGASEPEEYGYYFWWGDTVGYTYKSGSWISSKGESMTNSPFTVEACPTLGKPADELRSLGYIDATGNLSTAGDAATVHLGVPWRMPTDVDFIALTNNCTVVWTNRNAVSGRLVMGKGSYASKSIFLPAAGHGEGNELIGQSEHGNIWTSRLHETDDNAARCLYFSSKWFRRYGYNRRVGMPVRPVRDSVR